MQVVESRWKAGHTRTSTRTARKTSSIFVDAFYTAQAQEENLAGTNHYRFASVFKKRVGRTIVRDYRT